MRRTYAVSADGRRFLVGKPREDYVVEAAEAPRRHAEAAGLAGRRNEVVALSERQACRAPRDRHARRLLEAQRRGTAR